MSEHLFISHSSKNDDVVERLRQILELHGHLTWVDSRELRGGDDLVGEIENSVRSARHFLVVISIDALNSKWVQREVGLAMEVAQRRSDGYKVISVVLTGVQRNSLKSLFQQQKSENFFKRIVQKKPHEPLHIFVEDSPVGLTEAIPKIFAAIGVQLPEDWQSSEKVEVAPVEELLLQLSDPQIKQEADGKRRANATAELTYFPADNSRQITSRRYQFVAPLGAIELGEIRWYIESYFSWPTGVFKQRAGKTEQKLPEWGESAV